MLKLKEKLRHLLLSKAKLKDLLGKSIQKNYYIYRGIKRNLEGMNANFIKEKFPEEELTE